MAVTVELTGTGNPETPFPKRYVTFYADGERRPDWFTTRCPQGCWWEFSVERENGNVSLYRSDFGCNHQHWGFPFDAIDFGDGPRWVSDSVLFPAVGRRTNGRTFRTYEYLRLDELERTLKQAGVDLGIRRASSEEKEAWGKVARVYDYVAERQWLLALERSLQYPRRSEHWRTARDRVNTHRARLLAELGGGEETEKRIRRLDEWVAGLDPDDAYIKQALWDFWNRPEEEPAATRTEELLGW